MNPRSAAAIAAGWLLAALLGSPVLAHAELVSSDPANGDVLEDPPGAITLQFNDRLVAGRSFFELVPLAGGASQRGEVDPERPRRLTLVLATALTPGDYEVRWRAVADDGHNELERDVIRFTVLEPTPAPETPLPPTPTPGGTNEPLVATPSPAAPSPSGPAPVTPSASPGPGDPVPAAATADVLLPILAGLLLVAGVGAFVLRRSRRA